MNQPTPPASKLFIRSEVLAVIEFFTTVEDPPRHDKMKQLKRLSQINDQDTVLKVLIKELQRSTQPTHLQVVTELLMELGKIDILREPLWAIIQQGNVRDEIKDSANLILRHLGDQTDPSLYLDYLDDPEGLINRETERMLEIASRNPEALIDFIDFIFSLPVDEQCHLIQSLKEDYPPDHLVNLYIPTLEAQPPTETAELMIECLGQSKSKRAALYLHHLNQQPQSKDRFGKILQRAINELRIGGIYREENFKSYSEELKQPHPLVGESIFFNCFATIPDGIGNQGIIISRQKENGDVAMMCVAINDIHGVIDCFGFYQLSESDFHRITDKFHEECSKIKTPPEYCYQRLMDAEQLNRQQHFRVPYEYTCWKILLGELEQTPPTPIDIAEVCTQLGDLKWADESANLYHHPDFHTWFLEEGDHPVVTQLLGNVEATINSFEDANLPTLEKFDSQMTMLADDLVRKLMASDWRTILSARLADSAYLLQQQQAKTFSMLAATEVLKLAHWQDDSPITGFLSHYGHRCIEEDLLRIKHSQKMSPAVVELIDSLLSMWNPQVYSETDVPNSSD